MKSDINMNEDISLRIVSVESVTLGDSLIFLLR